MPFCIEHIGKFIKSLLLSNNMKTIIYEIPDTKREFRRYDVHAREIYNKIKGNLAEKTVYFDDLGLRTTTMAQLPAILAACNGKLEGKVILDLGCGSELSVDGVYRPFKPWLARALHEYGVKVIGVDNQPHLGEEFEYYQRDLMKEDSLSMIDNNSVDVVNAVQLLDSPILQRIHGLSAHKKLEENLLKQVPRILKPDGTFIYTI